MGAIELSTLECVRGLPSMPVFEGASAKIFPHHQIPTELLTLAKCLYLMHPPTNVIRREYGSDCGRGMVEALFGRGRQTGGALGTWLPTEHVVDGARAWVLLREWQEGGGSGWIGSPIERRAYEGAMWIDEEPALAWANDKAKDPFIAETFRTWRSTKSSWNPYPCVQAESAPTNATFNRYQESDGLIGIFPKGTVYAMYSVAFDRVTVGADVITPNVWCVRRAYVYNASPRIASCSANRTSESVTWLERVDGYEDLEFVETLANVGTTLTDATGDVPAFFATNAEWERFADAHGIYVMKPKTALHGPSDKAETLCMLTPKFATLAYAAGATRLPAVVHDLHEYMFTGVEHDGGDVVEEGPLFGTWRGSPQYPNSRESAHLRSRKYTRKWGWIDDFHGWVRPPRGLSLSHAATIRAVDDPTVDPNGFTLRA